MKARVDGWASLLAIAVTVALLGGVAAAATASSNVANVQLNATLQESLTVTVSAGTNISFALAPNTASNPGGATSTVTTAWVLKPGRSQVAVWAYFSSATALISTTGGTATIPSSAVGVQVNGSGSFTACTAVSPFNAASSGVLIGTTAVSNSNTNSNRTDTLAYNIDTTVVPQLPADSYAGVLNIQAQATP